MSSLTDRYVEATLRRLPTGQRQDIERELRSSIADAVDDRVTGGEDPAAAESAVLTALGDPAKLAASYANRPLHLIGPRLYTDYVRTLTALISIVVPIVAVVVAIGRAVDNAGFGEILGGLIGAAITTAVQIAFWVTLVFAVLERTGAHWDTGKVTGKAWTPADLPAPPSRRARFGELIAECVATVVFAAFILLSPTLSLEKDAEGNPIPVLDPWLWDTGIVYVFLALVVAGLGFAFARYYAKWSLPVEVIGALVRMAPSALLIWLAANDHVINPAFITSVGWPEAATRWIGPALMIAGAIGIVSTVSDTIRHARQR